MAANTMGNLGKIRKLNEWGFKWMGLQWLTGLARRYSYNVGAIDAYTSANKLAKFVSSNGKNALNTSKGLRLVKDLNKYSIDVEDGLRLGIFNSFDDAVADKAANKIINQSGILASNRDALIPQVSNRLLFTQSRNPWVRLMGQFTSWAMAKSTQTNKILQRIENGETRQLVKLLAALPVYGGIKMLREIAKHGEVKTDPSYNTDKWWAEALRLSGMSGILPELTIGRLTGPGSQMPWFIPFPAASIATDVGTIAKDTLKGDTDKAWKRFLNKIAPFPTWRKMIMRLFSGVKATRTYKRNNIDSSDNKITPRKFFTGGRVGYEHGDEVILPQEKPIFQTDAQASEGNPGNKELGSPVKKIEDKDMNKKDMAAILAAGSIAAGATVFDKDIKKAVDNGLLPAKKPIVIVEKNYNNISDLDPEKKEWLFNTAEKVYLTNKNNVIPNDIILAINGGETGWGSSGFLKRGSKNLFNFQSFNDKEESIAAQNSNAKIKKFKTEEDSIKQFLDWVENKDSYSGVREEIKLYNEGEGSKERIIDAIAKTGFAEDKKWSGKIKSILNKRIDGKHKKELQKLATILFTGPGNKN